MIPPPPLLAYTCLILIFISIKCIWSCYQSFLGPPLDHKPCYMLSTCIFVSLQSFDATLVAKVAMVVKLGGSRKYPYPYHRRHLGIPKGRGGTLTGIPRTWGGSLDWNSEGMGGFSGGCNFQFGVVKSLQEKLVS